MKFTTAIFGLASARKLGVIALAGLASGLLGAETAAAQAAGDPVQGKATFARCGICHTVEIYARAAARRGYQVTCCYMS